MLAAGALVASLLAVGSAPAGAVNQFMDERAGTSACVGPALADQMFTDVVDEHAFVDAINCIAYYGITNGSGDGSTYAPNQEVTRAEMAVFISRAAEVAGVSLGSGSGGFSDIGDIWQEAQDAINGLASKGMIPSGGEFRPHDAIKRKEMATFLVGLLVEGASNVTLDNNGDILIGTGGAAAHADDHFADARARVPRDNDEEISALYELGVTTGASAHPGRASGSNVLVTMYTTPLIVGDHVDDDNNATTPSNNDDNNPTFIDTRSRSRSPQGSPVASTIPLTLDDDGKATFSVSGLGDSATARKVDKYEVDIRIQHTPAPGASAGPNLPPLPYDFDPDGTVNRGEMAAFITRALAHTDARPEGITAQYSNPDVVVSVRDENFAPVANVVVDLFRIDTNGIDLAFRSDGTCAEAAPMDSTATTGYTCEIDGTDHNTGADGDVRVNLGDKVDDPGGTTVWVWTGDNKETVDSESELYQLDISVKEAAEPATAISVTTEHGGEKAHLGRSVVYTVQLVDKDNNAVGNPADAKQYSRALSFVDHEGTRLPAYRADNTASISAPDGANPSFKQFAVAQGGATADIPTGDGGGGWDASLETPAAIDAKNADGPVIFSTEAGVIDVRDIFVKVKPAAKFAVVDPRGAGNRATVTVTDQYGDPIPGIRVRLDSRDDSTTNNTTASRTKIVPEDRYFAVGRRDGSYSFGYENFATDSSVETLVARIEAFDHDGDTSTTALKTTVTNDQATSGSGFDVDLPSPLPEGAGTATVEWAVAGTGTVAVADALQIMAFDTEMNTLYVGTTSNAQFVRYDSNDRFNKETGPSGDREEEPVSYAAFEKLLSKDTGYELAWTIVGSGSRSTNTWTLVLPAS